MILHIKINYLVMCYNTGSGVLTSKDNPVLHCIMHPQTALEHVKYKIKKTCLGK